jgi:putative ABC transport system permease protein
MMYFRIIGESLRRGARAKLAAFAAVALGAGTSSALAMIQLGVGDRMAAEMRRYDANLEIVPEAPGARMDQASLAHVSRAFWSRQVKSLVPELSFERGPYAILGRDPDPGWTIEGRPGVLAGVSLDLPIGATIEVGRPLVVTGRVGTGGEEDGKIIVPLELAQELAGEPGKISRVKVSATVTPETEAYRLFRTKARIFTPQELEQLSCTPFPDNVARSLGGALGGEGRVLRRVADSEGAFLRRIDSVLWVLVLGALIASCLSVLSAMTATVMERRQEVGLLKALGATDGSVAGLFLGEALVIALSGSLAGYALGLASAKALSGALFGDSVPGSLAVYLLTLLAALVIVCLGVAWPLRLALKLLPSRTLHEA